MTTLDEARAMARRMREHQYVNLDIPRVLDWLIANVEVQQSEQDALFNLERVVFDANVTQARREGQERMRERAAREAEAQFLPSPTARLPRSALELVRTIAAAIRALPVED